MDVTKRIMELTQERGRTEYRLVKESGLPASTISNIFHRNTIPNIITLEDLCATFGISLSRFFAEGDEVPFTEEEVVLINRWAWLSEEQKRVFSNALDLMLGI